MPGCIEGGVRPSLRALETQSSVLAVRQRRFVLSGQHQKRRRLRQRLFLAPQILSWPHHPWPPDSTAWPPLRQRSDCSTKRHLLRQYGSNSASSIGAPSSTTANLSAALRCSGFWPSSGTARPCSRTNFFGRLCNFNLQACCRCCCCG